MNYYRNKTTGLIKASPIEFTAPAKDKDGKEMLNEDGTPIMVKMVSNSESVLAEQGWEPYTPPKGTIDVSRHVRIMRFDKRKIKAELVGLGLWEEAKAMLTESEFEDLVLTSNLVFRDPLFTRIYDALKSRIEDIDERLAKCGVD